MLRTQPSSPSKNASAARDSSSSIPYAHQKKEKYPFTCLVLGLYNSFMLTLGPGKSMIQSEPSKYMEATPASGEKDVRIFNLRLSFRMIKKPISNMFSTNHPLSHNNKKANMALYNYSKYFRMGCLFQEHMVPKLWSL